MEGDKKRIQVVVDSNIVFSLIIRGKQSMYLDLFLSENLELYAPEEIIYEFRKHSERLKNRSDIFDEAMFLAFSFIRIMPREFYLDFMQEAYNICKFDEKDTPFIALALKLGIPVWTNDKGIIENSGIYKVITTAEIEELIKSV